MHAIGESAFYRWRQRYGYLEVNEVRCLRMEYVLAHPHRKLLPSNVSAVRPLCAG